MIKFLKNIFQKDEGGVDTMSMFCYQCQEAAGGKGCTKIGVCGKSVEVANLQDLLIHAAKGVAIYNYELRNVNANLKRADNYLVNSLFMTITNANFDKEKFVSVVKEGLELRDELKKVFKEKGISSKFESQDAAVWTGTEDTFETKAGLVGILRTENEDVRSLRELITYGLKGMAAYAEHAYNLGYENEEIYIFLEKALIATIDDSLSGDELTALALETGKYGVQVMALLDSANTSTFGNPEITEVNIGVGTKPGILVSGHDLNDLVQLLEQSKDSGVDIYTHSEMLPAHYYPELKKYSHLIGNYGNAWWKQAKEFESFNGPILFTTNCLVPPKSEAKYQDKVYTTGAAGFEGFPHIEVDENGKKDFTAVIEHAKKCKAPTAIEEGKIVGGFAHNQVLALADKVVGAVKSGAIRKFFVMAGCDGRMKSRDYYTEFAEKLPKDTVILTAGCAKYKYNKLDLGYIGGIPRVLDAGQCNDSYSLAVIALKLKEVFQLNDINELPIAYNIAWYEQKAVIVLLALLHLGVKNIHLGPSLPAFLSPNVANVLVENFGIKGIGAVDEDIKMFLGE